MPIADLIYRSLLFVSLVTMLVVAVESLRRGRGLQVHRALFWATCALITWIIGTLLETLAEAPALDWLGEVIIYTGTISVGPWTFLLCHALVRGESGRGEDRLSSAARWGLVVPPVLLWLTLVTNPYHHLFISGGTSPDWERGPVFWVHCTYTFTLVGIGLFIVGQHWQSIPRAAARWHLGLFLGSTTVTILGCLAWIFKFTPAAYNPTPAAFSFLAFCMGLFILRGELFDVLPLSAFAIFERLGDGVVVWDSSGRIVSANSGAEHFLGVRETELLGRTAAEVVYPRFGWEKPPARFVRGERCRVELIDFQPLLALAVQQVRVDAREQATAHTALHMRDITVEYLADQDLRRSEATYRLLYTDAADAIYSLDTEGHIIAGNDALVNMTGYTLEEWRQMNFMDAISPESAEIVTDAYRRLLAGETVNIVEYAARRKDGTVIYLSASLRPVVQDGHVVRIEGSARDITERMRAAEHEAALQAQLTQAQKLGALGRMLAGVAHELNNPLSGILGYAELLSADGSIGPDQRDMAERILGAAEQCQGIITNLLRFARNGSIEPEPVAMAAAVEQVLSLARDDLDSQDISVEVDVRADLWVHAEAAQLQQCLLNLVINARDALEGAPRRVIRVRGAAAGKRVRLTVEDTGPGVAAGVAEKMFDPFYTTKDVGAGTGLGLSLCHSIATSFGGEMEHDPTYTDGARFVLTLPRVKRGGEAPRADTQTPPPTGAGRILVVDDDRDVRDFCVECLERTGYDVLAAENGVDALSVLGDQQVDLIVSDVRMPQLDGPGLHAELTARGVTTPMVFITGDAVRSETTEFLQASNMSCLHKPFRTGELISLVRASIGRAPGTPTTP